jgi:hypothetical protein
MHHKNKNLMFMNFPGVMESTIVKTFTRTANLRRWLHRPDCPEAIRQLKVFFDNCFVPANAPRTTEEFVERTGVHRANVHHNGVIFSRAATHSGNSTIIYRPTPNDKPVAGQIQRIENIRTPEGKNHAVQLHVRSYQPLTNSLHDPFLRYIHFHARTYSSTLKEVEDIIELDDIVAHAARFDYSHGRSVFVSLSRQ